MYTDVCTREDSLLFKKFEKEEKIKVYIYKIKTDSIFKQLKTEKYNANADLIILSEYEKMLQLAKNHFLLPIESPILWTNIDPSYRSKKGKWFALGKTPLVLVYNSDILVRDSLKNYQELIQDKWKGKIAFQSMHHPTQLSFRRSTRCLMKAAADSFLIKLNRQRGEDFFIDDLAVLESIQLKKYQLAIVKLSSLLRYNQIYSSTSHIEKNKLLPFMPDQRRKGAYYTITSGGVYRFSKNSGEAKKLLEFLSSKRAQYKFSAGRYEFPILKNVALIYELKVYRKIRGRFYKEQ